MLLNVVKWHEILIQVRVCILNTCCVELNALMREDENHHGENGKWRDTLHIINFCLAPFTLSLIPETLNHEEKGNHGNTKPPFSPISLHSLQ